MNLDFTKPRPKAKEMAMEMGIDLTDQVVIREFQKIQSDRLKELRDVKEGKKRLKPDQEDVPREDFNDVFRESNRAVIDHPKTAEISEEEKVEEEKIGEEKIGEETKEKDKNILDQDKNESTQPKVDKKLDEEEDEYSFDPKTIIISAIF